MLLNAIMNALLLIFFPPLNNVIFPYQANKIFLKEDKKILF